MKLKMFAIAGFLFAQIQALEYQQQFDNDQFCISKVKILPKEKIGLHGDQYPQIVIALKGGVITRIEQDGKINQVKFPTGEAVLRPPDPAGKLHQSVNDSAEAIELITIQLKQDPSALSEQPASHVLW